MKSVIVRAAAARDIEEAFEWYENRRIGLGDEFLDAVQQTLLLVAERPGAYPVIHRDTRRVVLHRFPYTLLYREDSDQIVIVACMHMRRSRGRWQSRS